jgi:hypothetical protein
LCALPIVVRRIVGILIVSMTAVSLYGFFHSDLKDDWRSAAQYVLSVRSAQEIVLTDGDIEALPFWYYAKRGSNPPESVFGLMPESPNLTLSAVRFANGEKIDWAPKDYSHEIWDHSEICLALCVPSRKPEEYVALFEAHGYKIVSDVEFYRIRIIRFARSTTE